MVNKILIVIRREYITRVRKKSFIIMTILAPILIVAFYGLIFYFAFNKDMGDAQRKILVSDESGYFTGKIKNKSNLEFEYGFVANEEEEKQIINSKAYYAILDIPKISTENSKGIKLIANDQPSISTVNYIEGELEQVLKEMKLKQFGIEQDVIRNINKTNVNIRTIKVTAEGGLESSSAGASTGIGYISAILIYLFIFLYGVQVMRGVIEEKTNRIVEVIISSLKPFELMMGKIVGIALVGLTQFVIWILLVVVLGSAVSGAVFSSLDLPAETMDALNQPGLQSDNEIGSILQALSQFNYTLILSMFVFYFVSGYLFYGSLFAAIGSAVDNETDTQQFMLPITMPLVFALVLAQSAVIANPNGSLAFWLSVIPFTSPVVMMVRIPFGVPAWQIAASAMLMISGFIFTVWMAARIYRIGILMYGKKPSYKEIGKWLFSRG